MHRGITSPALTLICCIQMLISSYMGLNVHSFVLPVCLWVSSGFTGYLTQPKILVSLAIQTSRYHASNCLLMVIKLSILSSIYISVYLAIHPTTYHSIHSSSHPSIKASISLVTCINNGKIHLNLVKHTTHVIQ